MVPGRGIKQSEAIVLLVFQQWQNVTDAHIIYSTTFWIIIMFINDFLEHTVTLKCSCQYQDIEHNKSNRKGNKIHVLQI